MPGTYLLCGNTHMIRHSETTQKSLGSDRAAGDYLFLRMFAFLHAVLAAAGRLEEAARPSEEFGSVMPP